MMVFYDKFHAGKPYRSHTGFIEGFKTDFIKAKYTDPVKDL